jgi:hypothetical protein
VVEILSRARDALVVDADKCGRIVIVDNVVTEDDLVEGFA